ncbi:lipase [Thozetella sp. PMI_491]|nr:lipase [Thozetella sp. PMI_491]
MRLSSLLVLSAGAAASPVLRKRAAVTTAQLTSLKLYAEYSAASYCNSAVSVGTTITCAESTCPTVQSHGSKVLATFDGLATDQQGYVTVDTVTSQIIVSFKGSHSVRNWITNLEFLFTDCDFVSDCKVHTGFANAWTEVESAVLAAVKSATAAHPTFKVITTGHSLGGAVATLGGAYLRKAGYSVDIYTFGSPRVGNDAFADFVTAQAGAENRVTHLNDLVPRLPPLVFGYRHTSPEYWLSDGTATTTSYGVDDIKVCTGNANTGCNGSNLLFDVTAHLYYFEEIAGCGSDDFSLKRATDTVTTMDDDTVSRLNDWAEQDRQYAAELAQNSTLAS